MDSKKKSPPTQVVVIEEIQPVKNDGTAAICEECGKSFLNRYTLNSHKNQVHYGIRQFQCEICEGLFTTLYKLKRHHLGVHSDKRDFRCEVCGMSYKTRDMKLKHQRTHFPNNQEWTCEECNSTFKYKSGLDYHMKLKHKVIGNDETQKEPAMFLQCLQCQKSFNSTKLLNVHMKRHLKARDEETKLKKKLEKIEKLKSSENLVYICSYCKKEYKSKANFEIHIASHEERDEMEDYEFLNEEFVEEESESLIEVDSTTEQLLELKSSGVPEDLLKNIDGSIISIQKIEAEFEDEEIEEENVIETDMEEVEHEKIVQENLENFTEIEVQEYFAGDREDDIDFYESIITRDLEPAQLEDENDLIVEQDSFEIEEQSISKIKKAIADENRSVCHECGSTFKNVSHLKRHVQRKHRKNEHKLECDICGSKFLLAYDLKRHMIKHSTKRQFPCNLCEKEFKTEVTLKSHMKVLHSETERNQKDYKCPICERAYFHHRHLEYHMRKHTADHRYSCNLCVPEKTFHYADAIKWHMIRHHGKPAPFRCTFEGCNKIFIHEKSLHTHEKEHNPISGSLSVECPVCNKFVSEKRHLKRHMRSHQTKEFQCACGTFFKERFQFTKHKQNCKENNGDDGAIDS